MPPPAAACRRFRRRSMRGRPPPADSAAWPLHARAGLVAPPGSPAELGGVQLAGMRHWGPCTGAGGTGRPAGQRAEPRTAAPPRSLPNWPLRQPQALRCAAPGAPDGWEQAGCCACAQQRAAQGACASQRLRGAAVGRPDHPRAACLLRRPPLHLSGQQPAAAGTTGQQQRPRLLHTTLVGGGGGSRTQSAATGGSGEPGGRPAPGARCPAHPLPGDAAVRSGC